jgi:hypothetical protein
VPLRIPLPHAIATLAVIVLATAAALISSGATRAAAQNPPATYYGVANAGDTVAATIGGVACASAKAGPDGFWLLTVAPGGACGAADQREVRFTLNGHDTGATERWRSGGAPSDAAAGITLAAQGSSTGASTPASPPSGAFVGTRPAAGKLGLLVTGSATRTSDLLTALQGAGCQVKSLAILSGGRWRVHIPGAPAAINAAFPADLGASAAFAARC